LEDEIQAGLCSPHPTFGWATFDPSQGFGKVVSGRNITCTGSPYWSEICAGLRRSPSPHTLKRGANRAQTASSGAYSLLSRTPDFITPSHGRGMIRRGSLVNLETERQAAGATGGPRAVRRNDPASRIRRSRVFAGPRRAHSARCGVSADIRVYDRKPRSIPLALWIPDPMRDIHVEAHQDDPQLMRVR
jgi:hypothetical protein